MTTIWDVANKSASITLGRTSVIATTNTANGTWKALRATTSQSSGKFYLEFAAGYLGNNGFIVGFGNASLNTASYVGSDANSFGYQCQGSVQGGLSGTWQGMTKMGEVVQIAIDLTAKLVWARTDRSTNWNGSGTADPATGVGGKSYPVTGALFPAASLLDGSGANTVAINAGGFTFTGTIPSGFAAWDTGIPTGTLNTTTTTWDAATKNANVTLSNGNKTASQSTLTGTWASVRSTTAGSYGQVYFEITVTAYDSNSGILMGLADASFAVGTNNQYVGVDTHSTGVQAGQSGVGWQFTGSNGSGQPGFQLYTTHVLGYAVDLNRGLAWVKNLTSAGNWNNDATADPVTGKRGAAIAAANVYIAAALFRGGGNTDTVVLNTGPLTFTGTIPSGYVGWDSLDPTGVVEAATASDLYTPTVDYAISHSEAAAATETFTATQVNVDQFVTEALLSVPADAYIDQYVIEVLIPPIVTADIVEAATATDDYPGGRTFNDSIAEAASALDILTATASYNVSQDEAASALDDLNAIAQYVAHVDETASGGGGASAADGFDSPQLDTLNDLVTETMLYESPTTSTINALTTETMISDSPTTSDITALTTETLFIEPTTSTVNSFVVETLLHSIFNVELVEDSAHATAAFIPQRIGAPKAPPNITVVSTNIPQGQQPYPPVPTNLSDWQSWNQQIATTLNLVLAGKQNNTLAMFSLKPNTTTTTLYMSQIGANSVITLTPLTENAAAERWYVSNRKLGEATITHSNAETTDRTFSVTVTA